jgi:biotin carboxyl carrier protein
MTRLRIIDRATGELVAEVDQDDPAEPPPGEDRSAAGPERLVVLPGAVRSSTRGRTAVEVVVDGWRFDVEVEDAALAELRERATAHDDAAAHDGPTEVHAIIPGRVVSVGVTLGDVVTEGQRLLAVEAMKMVNELRAPREGTIERLDAVPGQTVELGDLLVVIR